MPRPLKETLTPLAQGVSEPWTPPPLDAQLTAFAEKGKFMPDINTTIDTDAARRARFAAAMFLKGHTARETKERLMQKFSVSEGVAANTIRKLKDEARLHTNDDAAMDVIVKELTKHAIQRAQYFHDEAMAPLPDDLMLTPQAVGQVQRARVEASKEARASSEFVLNVFGRTAARWSSKQQVEVTPLSGGTPEQIAAVNKLLGIETRDVIDVTPEAEELP